ncbi:lecithin retinol acyltransferase family protein [Cupriavidus sp. USMAHM13]|uniref:lecithin retinol acyltransferase family protein n=1 Tax=Cupriavidus sp. USMAHM13 TaxID=1389192 RepID=UPI0018D4A409|nr:lecithin retinol acyltransferase family protein [Cupriavidus sp. USMAHM13]
MPSLNRSQPLPTIGLFGDLCLLPTKSSNMRAGDHLITPRTGYKHHGIYVGHERVIHYSGFAQGMNRGAIEETTLAHFSNGAPVQCREYAVRVYSPEETVERAYSRIGEDLYSLLLNNCEHFANWCIFGLPWSGQVNSFVTHGASAVAAYLGKSELQRLGIEAFSEIAKSKSAQFLATQAVAGFALTSADSGVKSAVAALIAQAALPSLAQKSTATAARLAVGGLATGSRTAAGVAALAGGSTLVAAAAPVALGLVAAFGVAKVFDLFGD